MIAAPASPAVLFNCCANSEAPDWSAFTALRLGGCIDHDGHTEGLVSHDRAQFFTVYGIDADGMAEAISDTREGAPLTAGYDLLRALAKVSGLIGDACPSLQAPGA